MRSSCQCGSMKTRGEVWTPNQVFCFKYSNVSEICTCLNLEWMKLHMICLEESARLNAINKIECLTLFLVYSTDQCRQISVLIKFEKTDWTVSLSFWTCRGWQIVVNENACLDMRQRKQKEAGTFVKLEQDSSLRLTNQVTLVHTRNSSAC